MKTRPILFSAPMVRAILDGSKTQTRRVVKMTDSGVWHFDKQCTPIDGFARHHIGRFGAMFKADESRWIGPNMPFYEFSPFPYGQIGDQLWVRETWAHDVCALSAKCDEDGPFAYAATDSKQRTIDGKWRPSIFMPRHASRITLEITGVRVERLNDISEVDAIAEGLDYLDVDSGRLWRDYSVKESSHQIDFTLNNPITSYKTLWESINGKGSWDLSPWVWVIDFKRMAA